MKASDGKVEYRYNPGFADVIFDHIRSTLSVKNLVFPKVENLLYYSNTKTDTTVTEIDTDKIQDVVLWGAHPCDTAAFDILRSIFCWDINDEFFLKRLEKLVVIGLSCHSSDEYCFCTSVGLSPDSSKGSDILLTPIKNGHFRAEILTEKGNTILASYRELFENYSKEEILVTEVKQKFNHEQVTRKAGNGI